MTCQTIFEIPDPFIEVLLSDIGFFMLMTSITGVGCKAGRVAGGAGRPAAMVQGEDVRSVEFRRGPGSGRMAGIAIRPEETRVKLRFRVAGNTVSAQLLQQPIDMTALTSHIHMGAGQREITKVVVKVRALPTSRVMAGSAIPAKLSIMGVLLQVTGIAIWRRGCEIAQAARIDMARGAVNIHMLTGQLEGKHIVIEVLIKAVHPVMTVETGRAKDEYV